jgi:hypothetical protein
MPQQERPSRLISLTGLMSPDNGKRMNFRGVRITFDGCWPYYHSVDIEKCDIDKPCPSISTPNARMDWRVLNGLTEILPHSHKVDDAHLLALHSFRIILVYGRKVNPGEEWPKFLYVMRAATSFGESEVDFCDVFTINPDGAQRAFPNYGTGLDCSDLLPEWMENGGGIQFQLKADAKRANHASPTITTTPKKR